MIRGNIIMIHKKNNNQGVFLDLLVAAKNKHTERLGVCHISSNNFTQCCTKRGC